MNNSRKIITYSHYATLAILIISTLILNYCPPTSRDALTHHLVVPKMWIEHGYIYEIPHLNFSYYPMNLNLLYLIPLLFENDIVPKYIHFLFALGTAWLILSYLKKRTTQTLSLLGALIFLSTPVIVKLSTTVYVDLGLVFFSWGSIFFLFKWANSSQSPRYLIFSAIFCGLGLGTKYNGIIVLFLLTLLVAIIHVRVPDQTKIRIGYAICYPIVYSIISIAVFSPWMIKNYCLTANPIYPLYNHHFNSNSEQNTNSNMSMKPWMQRKLIYKESFVETASIPLRIFFQGEDDNPRLFDGKLNPILFFSPFLLLIGRRNTDAQLKLEQLILFSFCILFVLYASFMVDMRIRYIAPIIPPLVVLTIFGLQDILKRIDGISRKRNRVFSRWMICAVVCFFLSMNVRYVVGLFQSVNPVPFILGETTREEYLTEKLAEYPAIQFINQIENEGIKVLALFVGKRLYYFDRPVESGIHAFAGMVATGNASENNIALQLQSKKFTHCIIGVHHFGSWANQIFDPEQQKFVSQWLKNNCVLLFSKNGYAVFELVPKNENSP
ncbi:MAG: phospholipid carrier-dependent glycosyltransferase [Desulfobacteraceae bacterium]|nr:phospholipid carrier-dependent glycosyltransferase [Desulfobacteraceae bacterium]